MKNNEESVWKSYGWYHWFAALLCFQSVAPFFLPPNSLKNLNSPTSPIFFVPKLLAVPTVATGKYRLCDRSGMQ